MSLDLNPRQRAMLAEMGVSVWLPAPAAETAPLRKQMAVADAPQAAPLPSPEVVAPPPAPRAAPVGPARQAPIGAAVKWKLNPPQPLYPSAQKASLIIANSSVWLLLLDSPTPADPLAGDAGRLLDNMLRAIGLQGQPEVFVSTVERMTAGEVDSALALDTALQRLPPVVVMALGLSAARAVLGGSEPLGRLRGLVRPLPDGTPLVISYGPVDLLRNQSAKAQAWVDWCQALVCQKSRTQPG